ncbi:hypothetical protein FQZ97_1239610 [compost metagenome]
MQRDDVDSFDHGIEIVPIGGLQRIFDAGRPAIAREIVNIKAKGLGALRHCSTNAAHADNAQSLAAQAVAQHRGGRPAGPDPVTHQHLRAFD